MNFELQDNQNGTFTLTAVDASGAPASFPSDTTLTSSNTAVATATPNSGFPTQWIIKAVVAGLVNMVANSPSLNISTTFSFTITGGPAVGFTATLTNVANN